MIEKIQLLRNIGKFDSVATGAQLPLARLSVIYAENGRGKTTLASILRSLGTGNPRLISERHRLGAAHLPHIVLGLAGGGVCAFQDGRWSTPRPNVVVFDDTFVAENVCSGIEVETIHRQNLHELILGARGVALNKTLQEQVDRIEVHNRELRAKADAIPAAIRGNLNVDDFCALPSVPDVADQIQQLERELAAARSAEEVRTSATFTPIHLPVFDTVAINALLARALPALESRVALRLQAHLAHYPGGGEIWISDGLRMLDMARDEEGRGTCPFCAQRLSTSPLIDHYRAYFSAEYAALKTAVARSITEIDTAHSGDSPAAFERSVRVAGETRSFWSRFADIPEVGIDTSEVARRWKVARDAVIAALRAKQAAPLEPMSLDDGTVAALDRYEAVRQTVEDISAALVAANDRIAIAKERAQAANAAILAGQLARLKATETRHSPKIVSLCDAYLGEQAAKADTERRRDEARAALDDYRLNVFPSYETAINGYLRRFNAGFSIGGVTSINTRAGSSATYNVVINDVPVALRGDGPSFRTTLSAGDRNTLALAFFFASIDQAGDAQESVVVIDDPITSLDEHRSLVTVQEACLLLDRVGQVIVLSHSKPFLCALWRSVPSSQRAALRIARNSSGSTIAGWDVNQDCLTEHDRRHARVLEYLEAADPTIERLVAADLRHILEAFMRVAYPVDFPPGTLLGPFLNVCKQRLAAGRPLLNQDDVTELELILTYANRFHHDTNPAYQTEIINDRELESFVRRTLAFARR